MNHVFDEVISSGDIRLKKPDPKAFQVVAKRLNLSPSNCIFVDDSVENVEGAKKAGMVGIHFQSLEQLKAALKKLGAF